MNIKTAEKIIAENTEIICSFDRVYFNYCVITLCEICKFKQKCDYTYSFNINGSVYKHIIKKYPELFL